MIKESFELDPAHTVIGFSAKHLGVTAVRGRFWRFRGWFAADREDLAGAEGEVSVETTSISTGEDQRDAHLRSPDFFNSEKFPHMKFRLTSIAHQADNAYVVHGDLTIKETSRPIVLHALLGGETPDPFSSGTRIGISLTGQVDRMEFGLNWDGLAGAVPMVARNIEMQIDAELVTAPLTAKAAIEAASGMDEWIERLSARELEQLQLALARMARAVGQRLEVVNGSSSQNGAAPAPAPAQEPARRRGLLGRFGRTD